MQGDCKMKKILIVAIVAAVLLISTVVGITVYANAPGVIVKNSISGVFDDLAERKEIAPILKMAEKGSLSLDVNSEESDFDVKLGGKIYFGKNDKVYIENLFVESDNIELSADAYFDGDYAYIDNEEILGGAYGIARGELADEFAESIFAYGSGSEFSLVDQVKYNEILAFLKAIDSETDKDFQKDYEKLVKKYSKLVMRSVNRHVDYEKERDEVKLGGEYKKVRVVTVSMDEKALAAIIKDVCKEIEDDKKLKSFFLEYGEYIFNYMENMDVQVPYYTDLEELYEDMLDDLDKLVEKLDDKDEIEETLGDFKVEIDVVTPKGASKLLQLSLTLKSGGSKQEVFKLDLGKNGIKKTDTVSLDILDGALVIEYKVTENSSTEYIGKLRYSSLGTITDSAVEDCEIFRIVIDKKEDEFKLTLPLSDYDYDDVVLRGDFVKKMGKTTVVIDKIEMGGEVVDNVEIKLVVDEKDSMPKPLKKNKVTSVFEMSEKTFKKLAEKFGEDLSGYSGSALPDGVFGSDDEF